MKKSIKPVIIIIPSAVLLVTVLLIFFGIAAYNINADRLDDGKEPVFVFYYNGLNDGGTQIYYGLGYHIVKWHPFIENTELVNPDSLGVIDTTVTTYVTGWDIRPGYGDRATLENGPSPEHTIGFKLEFR